MSPFELALHEHRAALLELSGRKRIPKSHDKRLCWLLLAIGHQGDEEALGRALTHPRLYGNSFVHELRRVGKEVAANECPMTPEQYDAACLWLGERSLIYLGDNKGDLLAKNRLSIAERVPLASSMGVVAASVLATADSGAIDAEQFAELRQAFRRGGLDSSLFLEARMHSVGAALGIVDEFADYLRDPNNLPQETVFALTYATPAQTQLRGLRGELFRSAGKNKRFSENRVFGKKGLILRSTLLPAEVDTREETRPGLVACAVLSASALETVADSFSGNRVWKNETEYLKGLRWAQGLSRLVVRIADERAPTMLKREFRAAGRSCIEQLEALETRLAATQVDRIDRRTFSLGAADVSGALESARQVPEWN